MQVALTNRLLLQERRREAVSDEPASNLDEKRVVTGPADNRLLKILCGKQGVRV